jgi:tRNA A37 threonylcarbamoyladenosine synthetase subunit TsaC/SUA5/YrdC
LSILDTKSDARRVFDVVKKGGIAIIPNDAGYAIMGGSKQAMQRIFETKQRGGHKRNAMLCDIHTQRELHVLDRRARNMIEAITQDYGACWSTATPPGCTPAAGSSGPARRPLSLSAHESI